MRGRLVISAIVATVFAVVGTGQDKGSQKMTPEQQAAMEAWMRAATPGEPHRRLAEGVGTWDCRMTSWEEPGGAPNVSQGTSINDLVLGGRFLRQTFRGTAMGQPFNGLGYTGFDNVKKRYVSTWMDDMGTAIMVSYGTMGSDGSLTMTSEVADPVTGKPTKMREILRFPDKDHQVFEMYAPDRSGKEFKMMEILYSRSK